MNNNSSYSSLDKEHKESLSLDEPLSNPNSNDKYIEHEEKLIVAMVKSEWRDYSLSEYTINSTNNEIDKRSLSKYLNHLREMEKINNVVDLKMSNVVDFSFQYSRREESNNEPILARINENNSIPIENNNSENTTNKIDYEPIIQQFTADIFEGCKGYSTIDPCGCLSDVERDKPQPELQSQVQSQSQLQSQSQSQLQIQVSPKKNVETKAKEQQIVQLQEKLNTYKFQNRIICDENKKLLEVIHLFKMISNVNEREKQKNDDHYMINHNRSNSNTGAILSTFYKTQKKKIDLNKKEELGYISIFDNIKDNKILNQLADTTNHHKEISHKSNKKKIEIDNKQYISAIKTKEAKYGTIHNNNRKSNTISSNNNSKSKKKSINSYKSKQNTNNHNDQIEGKNGYKTYFNISSNTQQDNDKYSLPPTKAKSKKIIFNHQKIKAESKINIPLIFQNPHTNDDNSLIDVEKRLKSFALGEKNQYHNRQPKERTEHNISEKLLSILNENNNNNNYNIDKEIQPKSIEYNDIKSIKMGQIKVMTETDINTIDANKASNSCLYLKKKEEIMANNNQENIISALGSQLEKVEEKNNNNNNNNTNTITNHYKSDMIPYHLIRQEKLLYNFIAHAYSSKKV